MHAPPNEAYHPRASAEGLGLPVALCDLSAVNVAYDSDIDLGECRGDGEFRPHRTVRNLVAGFTVQVAQ